MEKNNIPEDQKQNISEINEIHEVKEKKIITNEIKELYEHSKKLLDFIESNKGILFIKNKSKNINIKIKNESFCKIYKKTCFPIEKLSSYVVNIIVNETTVEIASSTELYDDNNEKILHIIQGRNEFPVTMAKDMKLEDYKKIKKQIFLKSKSIKNILSKIGSLNDTITYIQISITQISVDYDSTRIVTQYIINRYKFLLDSKKIFYIVHSVINKGDAENEEEEEELEKYPVSYYSIKKIMELTEKDDNQKEKYFSFGLLNEDTENYEKENDYYLKKLTKTGESCEIYRKFKENEQKNLINTLERKVDIRRMKKVGNDEMNQIFNLCEDILNNKNEKPNDNDNGNIINNNDNIINNDEDKLKRIEEKRKEINDAINNKNNRYIEIMHNNEEKKYINIQNLDLLEYFHKKCKYKMDYYIVKNDRFKDVEIPSECIENYIRYKKEYEKKQFVLINLNSNENEVNYLVNLNDLKLLYDEWTELEKEQIINTENPQFEGKKINLEKICIVNIGEIKELPVQPDLAKKIKEEKENNKDKKSSKIYEKYPDIYKKANEKGFITIRRVIKKRKKKGNKK